MISFETAVRLKEAGLKWEPKLGDFYTTPDNKTKCCHEFIFEVHPVMPFIFSDNTQIENISIIPLRAIKVLTKSNINKWGDLCSVFYDRKLHCVNGIGNKTYWELVKIITMYSCLWLPRLDQLLAQIEAEGYKWGLLCEGEISISGKHFKTFTASSPDQAAAEALIWILESKEAKK